MMPAAFSGSLSIPGFPAEFVHLQVHHNQFATCNNYHRYIGCTNVCCWTVLDQSKLIWSCTMVHMWHLTAKVPVTAGQMKDIITTGLGMILFGDVQFSSKNLLGITLGLLGGMLYSFFGYMERQRQKQQEDKV